MGILKSAADTLYTIRFLKLLVTPFEETAAFKAGIIDADGNKNPNFSMEKMDDRDAAREHYTVFHRLVFNLKKIMGKAPGGTSVVARYGAALALIKEHGQLSNKNIDKIHENTGISILDVLQEQSFWYVLEDGSLGPGIYRMNDQTITEHGVEVRKGDSIRVVQGAPVDIVLGLPIYEGFHMKSGQRVLATSVELCK